MGGTYPHFQNEGGKRNKNLGVNRLKTERGGNTIGGSRSTDAGRQGHRWRDFMYLLGDDDGGKTRNEKEGSFVFGPLSTKIRDKRGQSCGSGSIGGGRRPEHVSDIDERRRKSYLPYSKFKNRKGVGSRLFAGLVRLKKGKPSREPL